MKIWFQELRDYFKKGENINWVTMKMMIMSKNPT